jgi:hypothetical protein
MRKKDSLQKLKTLFKKFGNSTKSKSKKNKKKDKNKKKKGESVKHQAKKFLHRMTTYV